MNAPTDLSPLHRDGFVLLRQFLDEGEHAQLAHGCRLLAGRVADRSPVDPVFQSEHGSTSHTFVNKHSLVAELNAIASSRKIEAVSAQIFGADAVFHMSLLQHNEAGRSQALAWHRDVAFRFGAMQMCNLLLYPLGTDRQRGGIRVVPGSHRTEHVAVTDSFAPVAGERELFPQPRDLLILDGACYHAVSANRSLEDRMAFNLRFRHRQAPKEVTRYGEYPTGVVDYLS